MKCYSLIGLSLVALLAATTVDAANIVANPGFESGAGADATDWNELEIAGGVMGASSIVDRTSLMPHSGTSAIDFAVVGAPDYGPVAEIQQQTPVGSVVGGQAYDFSYWVKGVAGPGSVSFYEVLWFDGDGSSGGGPQGSATGLQVAPLNAAYTSVGQSGLVAPATADSVLVQIRLVTGAFTGASGSMTVDDVAFAAVVPEPASLFMAVLCLASLGMTRRRNRQV